MLRGDPKVLQVSTGMPQLMDVANNMLLAARSANLPLDKCHDVAISAVKTDAVSILAGDMGISATNLTRQGSKSVDTGREH